MSERLIKLRAKERRAFEACRRQHEKFKAAFIRAQTLKQRAGELQAKWLAAFAVMAQEEKENRQAESTRAVRDLVTACKMIGRVPNKPGLGKPTNERRDEC